MLHHSVPRKFEIGDEVQLISTVIEVLPSGRARVSIPSYGQAYAVDPPPRTRAGDKVVLVGDVIGVDCQANRLKVRIDCGGVITVDPSSVNKLKKHRQLGAEERRELRRTGSR